ncbi:MAG: HdeD family acid-resistance protein [Pseudorhodobacter sp.]
MTRSWMPMMAAGVVALLGGLVALINPTAAGVATTTLVGWAMLIVGALQGWAAYKSDATSARIRAGAICVAALFMGILLLFGPLGSGWLVRLLIALLLLVSGAAKIYAGRSMAGSQNQSLVFGSGGVSILMALVILFGLNLQFGTLLGIELLASGLAILLLAMHRRANPDTHA